MGNQFNIENIFRALYNLVGGVNGVTDFTTFKALFSHVWLWIVIIGYAVSVVAIFSVVYITTRLFELRKREAEYYSTLVNQGKSVSAANARWEHINSLMEGDSASQWREAITEADIMLDDVLTERGYVGDTLGEKLRGANSARFATLKFAGEAHGVRNKIAHQGSEFNLSKSLAQRTIAHYETVFRELGAI